MKEAVRFEGRRRPSSEGGLPRVGDCRTNYNHGTSKGPAGFPADRTQTVAMKAIAEHKKLKANRRRAYSLRVG
ncbi:hypothetical protein, partial [Streptomyces sp. NPDC001948]